jgi:hypothetical protein
VVGAKIRLTWKVFSIFGRRTGKFRAGKDKVMGVFSVIKFFDSFFVVFGHFGWILARQGGYFKKIVLETQPHPNKTLFCSIFVSSILVALLS